MTLIEVMVALMVAGIALGAGASVLGFLADQQDRPGISAAMSAHIVRSTLRDWVSHAILTTQGDAEFRGAPGSRTFGGNAAYATMDSTDSDLTFITIAATDLAETGTVVRLHIRRDSAGSSALVAELGPFRSRTKPTTIVIAPDAHGFQVRYLGSLFGRPLWQRSWISTSVLPAAVELRILLDSSSIDSARMPGRALLALPMIVPLAGRQ